MITREYASEVVLSKEELEDIKRAQWEIRYKGLQNTNESALTRALQAFTSILSFFNIPYAASLANTVVSAILSEPSMKDELISLSRSGEDYLQDLIYAMDDHPEWLLVKVKLPFVDVEYNNKTFRLVAGRGAIIAVKVKEGWITG